MLKPDIPLSSYQGSLPPPNIHRAR